jgi:hypothetical protein
VLKCISIAAAALIISAPAAAQITFESAPQAPAAKPPSPKSSRMICESQETIGSRLGATKVCMTWNEWQELKFRHREQFEKIQNQAAAIAMPPPQCAARC